MSCNKYLNIYFKNNMTYYKINRSIIYYNIKMKHDIL